jgi:hypothetical protein
MIRFWKMKNTIATGTVMSSEAASLIGNCCPDGDVEVATTAPLEIETRSAAD